MATTEIVLNEYIGAELRKKYTRWTVAGIVSAENTGVFTSSGKRPDIVVTDNHASPVCIETEFVPAVTVEADAKARLGQIYLPTGSKITCAFAVRIPAGYKEMKSAAIEASLGAEAGFEYCVFFGETAEEFHRWPASGFLPCSLGDLANAVASSAVSPLLIEQGATNLEVGAKLISATFESAQSSNTTFAGKIADCLRQDSSDQTFRMAATIVINALVFQETIAGGEGALADVNSTYTLQDKPGGPTKLDVLTEWQKILEVDYWPIFGIARQIVSAIPSAIWQQVFAQAFHTADALLSLNLGKNPDLVGTIFQRLITDRRFLATFYTAPSSAALMSGLAVGGSAPGGVSWGNVDHVVSLKIADFACGTGSLLCSAYAEVRKRLENAGIDSTALHRRMIENVLVGCDVLPSATHITASQLTSAQPQIRYERTKILTLPFGHMADGSIGLGAFDLLETQSALSTIATSSTGIGASTEEQVDAWKELGGTSVEDQSFDLVVMNPPFTRLTGGGGKSDEVSRPLFAAFKTTEADQKLMAKKFSALFEGSVYDGNAGAGSAFVEVGHRKLKNGGTIGLILHLSALSGSSWEKCRKLWRKHYRDIVVLSIAGHAGHDMAFSADTGVGECMVIGTRTAKPTDQLISVSLYRRPASVIEGAEMARRIRTLAESGAIASLESGPTGGTEIRIGDEKVGEIVTAPIPSDGPWPLFRIADHALAQTAHQMVALGKCWLPGIAPQYATAVPFCKLEALGVPGPYHLDISGGGTSGGAPRGPFELRETAAPATATYPVLKAHNESRERYLEIEVDAEAVARISGNAKVSGILESKRNAIWETRTRLHFATDLQFNSNALVAVLTNRPALGGRAWPSFKLNQPRYEKFAALWFNSTLGILAFWWIANKAQSGRGSVTTTRLASLTLPDPRTFTDDEIVAIDGFFDAIKSKPLLDVHECTVDATREEIDRFVIEKMIKATEPLGAQFDAIQLVRAKLCAEPTISGERAN